LKTLVEERGSISLSVSLFPFPLKDNNPDVLILASHLLPRLTTGKNQLLSRAIAKNDW